MPAPRATRYTVQVNAADRDFINQLARILTEQGPGLYGQPEAIAYLVRCHKATVARMAAAVVDEIDERTAAALGEAAP